MQHFSYLPSFGFLGTYSPTPCGLATVARVADGPIGFTTASLPQLLATIVQQPDHPK
ncbi:hypothetical protein [Mycobacterium sp. 1245111.1]|uniref:hypothetical protein n=1 Tax=Mycobacterium sp. 1245111.1 TaxID=1834073 RepID=UPI000B038A69|nr:hypothetical protein [Mycobacterium sp. 1245111.1]